MLVLNFCDQNFIKLPFHFDESLGDGADGQVFSLRDPKDRVVKLSILLDYPERNLHKDYEDIMKTVLYLKNNNPISYAKIYDFQYLGEYKRNHQSFKDGQKYILYYYIMEKLNKISDDEKKVFHTILSHEDKGLVKKYNIVEIKKILSELSRALDFDAQKVIFFYESLRACKIEHRDIHIRNIMKTNDGSFKMIDFDRCSIRDV